MPFTVETAACGQATQFKPGPRQYRPSPMNQLVAVLDKVRADIADPETTPAVRAQLTRALIEGVKLKLILQGHGAPKPVTARNDPSAKPTRKPKVEPVE
jgi:hypothetical protein